MLADAGDRWDPKTGDNTHEAALWANFTRPVILFRANIPYNNRRAVVGQTESRLGISPGRPGSVNP